MSRETSLAKNTLIMSIGTILPKISWLVTLPIITAGLTQVEYGTYDLISTLVSLFLPVTTLQLQTAAFRYLIDCKDSTKKRDCIVTNVIVFVVCTSIISLLILYMALYKLSYTIKILICLYFFMDILLLTLMQIIRGLGKPVLYSFAASIQPIVNMLLVVIFIYYLRSGLEGALIAMAVSTFLALFLVLIKGNIAPKIHINLLSIKVLKELISYSWPMIPNSLSFWMLNFSDRFVLIKFIGINANAIYGVANKIPQLLSVLNTTFTLAWQENASINFKDEDVTEYYSNMFNAFIRILSGITALLIAATPILFIILIRGDYKEAYKHMPILLMANFFAAISSFLGGIYVAHKKTKSVGVTTIIATVINLGVDLLLINKAGIYAASFSTLLSYIFLAFYRMKNILAFQKINYNWSKIGLYIAFLFIMCVLAEGESLYFNILNILMGLLFTVIINFSLLKMIID